ncbi:glycosyltransferase family 4 protein [Sphingobium lignivorans]|uniref:Glycosyltransferase involved in cell wall biosynthesis n=1 Tax=Sphingobium lignivorans TaxID=2735886 RepID=A0ABR6NEE2_9SPHN|nr:glycosyltransferase family 4 protein [Sphingobium lignivorans]MBB5985652.1 glycosyltransferase involved in cell wall biosynthesis [Sphingobium lignivorans]
MKAIFAHDHRFIVANDSVWSESQFEASLWQRYLGHFHTLTVAARRGDIPAGKTLSQLELSSAPRVGFELFPNLSSPRGLTLARPAARRRMRGLVARHDAVIGRLPSEMGLMAIAAARALGKPWAVEMVACPWDGLWNYGNLAGRAYAPVAWARTKRVVRQADYALYVTRDFLQRRYPTRAAHVVAASNVILTDLSEEVLERRLARITAARARPLRLGLIGTLRGRFKGIQTLLAALSQARTALPPLSLHILGGGDPAPWRAEAVRNGVQDIVHFEGTLPSGDPVRRWLDDIDIYLQPSLQEGLPRALIEAMSRGCPALASTVAGIPELLPREDLIAPGDIPALATLLRRRVDDTAWMARSARTNWETAQDYEAGLLEERRAIFWAQFAASCAAGNPT